MPEDNATVTQVSAADSVEASSRPEMPLAQKLEAALFWSAGPLRLKQLSDATGESPEAVTQALDELAAALSGRGLALVRAGDEASLSTAPGAAELIAKMRRDELDRELTKAAAETLAAVAYAGPISRAELEHLRGVNCAAALRALSARGLVEREGGEDGRGRYRTTVDLLSSMGVSSAESLPGYEDTRRELEEALARAAEADAAVTSNQ